MSPKARPGPLNLITDVAGISVGNAQDRKARTGVTVILPDSRCVMGGDVRGGGPGTRETDALDPSCLVDEMDAVVLSGGSVYGLDAASGVVAWLGARGRGFGLAGSNMVAPVVPSAILFDLVNGGDKAWGEEPPYRSLGREACEQATNEFSLGNTGAGLGARAGLYKGGLGSASLVTEDGLQVGAIVAVNAFGSPVVPGTKALWAAPYAIGDEMGPSPMADFRATDLADFPDDTKAGSMPGTNTTIGAVAVNLDLTPSEARRLAIMAQDGMARALRPIHSPMDGDTVFAIATAAKPMADPRAFSMTRLGTLAADCMTRAIGRAIWEARTLGDMTAICDL